LSANFLEEISHPLLKGVLHAPRALHTLNEFLHSSSGILQPLHLRKGVEPVCYVCHKGTLVGFCNIAHVLHIQQIGYPNLFASYIESQLHVPAMVTFVQLFIVYKIWSVDVEKSTTVT